MRKLFTGTLILVFCLITATCDITGGDETSPCGDPASWGEDFNTSNLVWADPTWNTFTEGTTRVFQISSPLFDNVCPDEHIQLAFMSKFEHNRGRISHQRLKYRYSIYGGEYVGSKTVLGSIDHFELPYEANFGIKQAYNNIPGSFWLYMEWIMDDYQDPDVDLNYFKNAFISVDIEVKWKEFASK